MVKIYKVITSSIEAYVSIRGGKQCFDIIKLGDVNLDVDDILEFIPYPNCIDRHLLRYVRCVVHDYPGVMPGYSVVFFSEI